MPEACSGGTAHAIPASRYPAQTFWGTGCPGRRLPLRSGIRVGSLSSASMRAFRRRSATAALLTTALGCAPLAAPSAAAAHAAGSIDYQFPLPLWLYVVGGAVAVAVSVPAATMFGESLEVSTGRNLYHRPRPWLRNGIRAIVGVLLVEVIIAGLFGEQAFSSNPATLLVWVDFWVGLGLLSAVAGPVWDLVN